MSSSLRSKFQEFLSLRKQLAEDFNDDSPEWSALDHHLGALEDQIANARAINIDDVLVKIAFARIQAQMSGGVVSDKILETLEAGIQILCPAPGQTPDLRLI
ncbi:hypothetical protein CCP2SC5_90053 [Azospirillaceae bacterium]